MRDTHTGLLDASDLTPASAGRDELALAILPPSDAWVHLVRITTHGVMRTDTWSIDRRTHDPVTADEVIPIPRPVQDLLKPHAAGQQFLWPSREDAFRSLAELSKDILTDDAYAAWHGRGTPPSQTASARLSAIIDHDIDTGQALLDVLDALDDAGEDARSVLRHVRRRLPRLGSALQQLSRR